MMMYNNIGTAAAKALGGPLCNRCRGAPRYGEREARTY